MKKGNKIYPSHDRIKNKTKISALRFHHSSIPLLTFVDCSPTSYCAMIQGPQETGGGVPGLLFPGFRNNDKLCHRNILIIIGNIGNLAILERFKVMFWGTCLQTPPKLLLQPLMIGCHIQKCTSVLLLNIDDSLSNAA